MRTEAARAGAWLVGLLLPLAALAQFGSGGVEAQILEAAPAAERERLEHRLHVLRALDPTARQALGQRAADWDALPLAERRVRRDAWHAWEALGSDERARLRHAAAVWAALPEARQQELAAEFAALDELERRGWLLGPGLGADWPRLHALFALVPPDEREAMLQLLRELEPQARIDLAVLAQRTPPPEREALRQALLSTDPGNRAAWLRGQVDPVEP